MDEVEAKTILAEELTRYRRRPYEELLALLDQSESFERVSPSGTIYQIEMQVFYDEDPKRTLRVSGAIDNGGWRTLFSPLCEDFIIAPDGSFVGE
jgi:hypothetical protein